MKNKKIIILLFLLLGFFACDNSETNYELAMLYLGRTEGCNLFGEGDVNIVADSQSNVYNTTSSQVEFAFVKDFVYRLNMVNKIPKTGWTDTIQHIGMQDGYVGRLLMDDGSYKYCRFFVCNDNYDANANEYLLLKYQSDFVVK